MNCGLRAAAMANDVSAGLVEDEGDLVLATGMLDLSANICDCIVRLVPVKCTFSH